MSSPESSKLSCRPSGLLVGLRVNAEKTKAMILGRLTLPRGNITVSRSTVETVNEFCYLGSTIQDDSSCDKDIRARHGVFGRLTNIWRDNGLSLHTKIRLYEALVLSTLLYEAEMWSMSVSNTKKLEAAHHKWQRKILKISWKDMITNKTIRERTGQDTLESIIRELRLRWFGHIYRMDSNSIERQVMDWTLPHFRRKRGRPRVSWTSTVKKDLDLLGLTWDEALDLTKDRSEWRDCTAGCASSTSKVR